MLLAASLLLLVCRLSAALVEAIDQDSRISWSKDQLFSTSNFTSTAQVENSVLITSSSSNIIVDLADDVSTFFHRYVTTESFHNASALYSSRCLMDFSSLFSSSSEGDTCKGYKMLDASGRPGQYILGGNFRITGSFDECLNIKDGLTQYYILPVLPLLNNTPIKFDKTILTFQTDVCLPRSCSTADLEFFFAELKANYITTSITDKYSVLYVAYSTICQESKRVHFTTGAIVMIAVCVLFLVLSLVGTAIDLGAKIIQWLLEKPEFSQMFSQTESDSSGSSEQENLLPTQSMVTSPSTEIFNKKVDNFESFKKPLEFIITFSIIKNIELIISTKQSLNTITCFNGIRFISMCWVILLHTFFAEPILL